MRYPYSSSVNTQIAIPYPSLATASPPSCVVHPWEPTMQNANRVRIAIRHQCSKEAH